MMSNRYMDSKKIQNYNFLLVEKKWQAKWEKDNYFKFDGTDDRKKYYVLEMLPYPSGKLHMGHVRNYTIGDVVARYKQMNGFNVLHPIGWDAFGLPAENAAIDNKSHPSTWTYNNIEIMKSQQKRMGLSYDWSREITTCDPDYYKHEQKMFIDFYNAGLVYRKESLINWDPVDNTVLANEQVINGRGWRSGAIVERRKLYQWYIKISDFAEELLHDIDLLTEWPEKVRIMQKNWIGKIVGMEIKILLSNESKDKINPEFLNQEIVVFTSRPEMIFGASFIAISCHHDISTTLALGNKDIEQFILKYGTVNPIDEGKNIQDKNGIFTGLYCDHPMESINGVTGLEKIPVFITNFLPPEYESGATLGYPAHNDQDFAFAIKHNLSIVPVISSHKDTLVVVGNIILRNVFDQDCDIIHSMCGDSDCIQRVGLLFSKDDTDIVTKRIKMVKDNGYQSMFCIVDKMTTDTVGYIAIMQSDYFIESRNTFVNDSDPKLHYIINKKYSNKHQVVSGIVAAAEWTFQNTTYTKIGIEIDETNAFFIEFIKILGFALVELPNNIGFYFLLKERFRNKLEHTYNCDDGYLFNSYFLNGLSLCDAQQKIKNIFEKSLGIIEKTSYKLHDWGVSRQRYWGCPIPMIHCKKCGIVAERVESLPIVLPTDITFDGHGNPLSNHDTWKHCKCPNCNSDAIRETDTFDTFFESSWYFLRYLSPKNDSLAFDKELANKMIPVDVYIGGIEHAVMHLLYARFFLKALRKCGYLDVGEPFKCLITQGMVCHRAYQNKYGHWIDPQNVEYRDNHYIDVSTGEILTDHGIIKMSKSKKNTIDPEHILNTYGADAARMFMLSDTPIDKDIEWHEAGIESVFKYMNRLWKIAMKFKYLVDQNTQEIAPKEIEGQILELLRKTIHRGIKNITYGIETFNLNKVIAYLHELSNAIEDTDFSTSNISVLREAIITLFLLIAPIAPHLSAEVLELLKGSDDQLWPQYDEKLISDDIVTLAIQVNGKLRGQISVSVDSDDDICVNKAISNENVLKAIGEKKIRRTIVVKNRIVNFVT